MTEGESEMMKIGAVYPQVELGGDPAALDRFARQVEAMGFDHLLIYDHVAGAARVDRDPPIWEHGPYTDEHPFHDPLVAFGYIAAITKRIELVTGILILPQRQTLLVARQTADVDLLSGGRLHLGVGLGWSYPEYAALGQDFATRGARMSEQIPYLRRLWSEPRVSFEGRFDRIDRMKLNPQPKRQIPIYCGGFTDPAYRRAAELADGFIFGADIGGAVAAWQRTQELLVAEGRDIAGFRPYYMVQHPGGRGTSLDDTIDALASWEEAGGTHASIVTMGLGLTTVDAHLDYLATIQAKAARS
jgi:probable F420-dependent oxidoreductase